jgi:ParG
MGWNFTTKFGGVWEKWVTDTTTPSIPAGPIARMTVELPLEMHRELKGKCGREGLKIKKVIMALVQEYLAGNIKPTETHLRWIAFMFLCFYGYMRKSAKEAHEINGLRKK